jgi:hypothetical protein
MFRLWPLLINLATALLLVGAVGLVTEWRVRRPGGLFRFHLFDLLAVLTLLGVIMGVPAYHVHLQQIEAPGLARPLPPGFQLHDGKMTLSQRYVGPVWLRKLAGNAYLIPTMHHVEIASVRLSDSWDQSYRHLPRLHYLTQFRADGGLPLEALPYLKRCRRLEKLILPPFYSRSKPTNPEELGPLLTPENLSLLAELRLTALELSGDQIEARHIEQIASFRGMKKIKLMGVAATPAEIESIRARHPGVEIIEQVNLLMLRC